MTKPYAPLAKPISKKWAKPSFFRTAMIVTLMMIQNTVPAATEPTPAPVPNDASCVGYNHYPRTRHTKRQHILAAVRPKTVLPYS